MSRTFGVPAKYTFTLNVDTHDLDARVGCVPAVRSFGKIPQNSTKIESVAPSHAYSFLDQNKKNRRWLMTMRDYMVGTTLPETINRSEGKKCWWCHQVIDGKVLGCPIKIIQAEHSESYYSYTQKKEISLTEKAASGYYLTCGLFDDWGCMIGFAESKRSEIVFRESIQLALKMYNECGYTGIPHASPPFTVLTEYGGPVTPEEYKTKYGTDTYKSTQNLYIPSRQVPVGELFEVTSKF